jgi:short-subunit dehydrogenase
MKSTHTNSNAQKVALVTGASSGIGMSAAIQLAESGFITYAAARRTDRMETLKQKGIRVLALDLTEASSIDACLQAIATQHGGVDVLVNNAGYGSYGSQEEVSVTEAKRQFDVNVFGLTQVTQRVLPYMRNKRWGRVINVSSIGGVSATPYGGWYHATKFAVEALSQALRQEVKPFGIDVVVIRPGGIKTEWAGIATESMEATSGKGAYKIAVSAMGRAFRAATLNEKLMAEPSVIANVIQKAATAAHPNWIYTAPYSGKFMVLISKLALMTGTYDMMLRMAFKLPKTM